MCASKRASDQLLRTLQRNTYIDGIYIYVVSQLVDLLTLFEAHIVLKEKDFNIVIETYFLVRIYGGFLGHHNSRNDIFHLFPSSSLFFFYCCGEWQCSFSWDSENLPKLLMGGGAPNRPPQYAPNCVKGKKTDWPLKLRDACTKETKAISSVWVPL